MDFFNLEKKPKTIKEIVEANKKFISFGFNVDIKDFFDINIIIGKDTKIAFFKDEVNIENTKKNEDDKAQIQANYDKLNILIPKPKKEIVIKTILNRSNNEAIFNEINIILNTTDLEYSIKVYACLSIGTNIHIIMEYNNGVDLFNYLTKLQPEDILPISKQLALGIQELHNKKIIHNDIKPENIMVYKNNDDIKIKLIDFGLSCYFEKKYDTTCNIRLPVGTPFYMLPINLHDDRITDDSLKKRDWYSYCITIYVIIYYILNKKMPVEDKDIYNIIPNILDPLNPLFQMNSVISKLLDLINTIINLENKKPEYIKVNNSDNIKNAIFSSLEIFQNPVVSGGSHKSRKKSINKGNSKSKKAITKKFRKKEKKGNSKSKK